MLRNLGCVELVKSSFHFHILAGCIDFIKNVSLLLIIKQVMITSQFLVDQPHYPASELAANVSPFAPLH